MAARSLADWLRWQESLNPRLVDLDLERVRAVLGRLRVVPPAGAVFTVAGTNGKGSTVALLQELLLASGRRTGLYTSPHLLHYNERIRIAGVAIDDESLVAAFERVEAARGDVPLTYFEFGTLAAFACFDRAGCDAWVLEVGMGGRLDAVNAVDSDYGLITTIALDHQDWLGDTVEEIAGEKAGIMRPGRPVFYGDWVVPLAITHRAAELGAELSCFDREFGCERRADRTWTWRGPDGTLDGLTAPDEWTDAQYRNACLVLAAARRAGISSAASAGQVSECIRRSRPRGRFEIARREHEWVLDVAHNPQAAAVLRRQLATLPPVPTTTAVVSLLADKAVTPFVSELDPVIDRWIVCGLDDPRASSEERMLAAMADAGVTAIQGGAAVAALELAARETARGGRIVVCGSFRLVAPALEWLGLY